ncbi:MAG: ABC transporter ATP-binding protein [Candidatus Dojkabacteria bacterium]|nr:MAG: ABC transporter ATP-binding protein [Candidatus Dojkabacteria bacterium]
MGKKTVPNELVIDINHLHKWYRNDGLEFHALDDVSLQVTKGEFVAIVGPSGSGKSTLMNVIGCLDRYEEGTYRLSGQEVGLLNDQELAHYRGKVIGFVFQSFNLLERYSVLDNVLLPSFYVHVDNPKERAFELLELLDIADKANNLPSQISGGQKQRVAIARSLLTNPDLILADEPTGNLDSRTGRVVLEIFDKLHHMGKTLLLITHDVAVAQYAHRQINILDGKIV